MSRKLGFAVCLVIALSLFWFTLSGYGIKQPIVSFGGLSIFITIIFALRMDLSDKGTVPFINGAAFLQFWVWLGGEIFKANIAVVKIVLSPNVNIKPSIVRVPVQESDELWRTTLANSITLTPGTVALDIQDDHFVIHALDQQFCDQASFTAIKNRSGRASRRHV